LTYVKVDPLHIFSSCLVDLASDFIFKIFNASHMAPFDVPHVAHDMMLRFMNVDFSSVIDGSARIPSSVGSQAKPVLVEEGDAKSTNVPPPAKSPEQNKAMWEGESDYLCGLDEYI
jgi:hypothetical protein